MAEIIEGGADDRAAMIAEMRGLVDAPAETETPAAAPPSEAEVPPAASDAPTSEVDADEGVEEDVEAEEEAAEPDPDPEADEPDPETAKRLQQVQRQERRAREALAAEKRDFETERERWRDESKEQRAEIERFGKLKERARYDLATVAKELGIPEEEFEYHAERLYRLSPKGQKDPRNKQMTEQAMRDRESADRIAKLEKQLEERTKQETEAQTAAEQRRAAEAYLDQAQKAVSAKHPLVAKMLKADAEWGRDKLRRTAARMIKDSGEVPAHAAVVAELEKRERARLTKLGVDIPQVGGTKDAVGVKTPATKAKHPGAGETTRPQAKSSGSERPAPKTQEDERREIVQAMKAGNLE